MSSNRWKSIRRGYRMWETWNNETDRPLDDFPEPVTEDAAIDATADFFHVIGSLDMESSAELREQLERVANAAIMHVIAERFGEDEYLRERFGEEG